MSITCPKCQCRIELLTGEPLNLTLTEHRLLAVFRQNPMRFINKAELLEVVWDWPMTTVERATTTTVRVHISRLRRKLADAGYADVIETAKGRGWRLVPNQDSALVEAA